MVVKVVTDSTSDLPPELAKALDITVVPLNVHFGTETLLDRVDITPDEFYRRLVSSPRLPTTSQPSVGAFMEVYGRLAPSAEAVASVHISSKISGTCNSALQAVQALKAPCAIEVVDTLQASVGLGLIAIAAARLAQKGAGLKEVLEETRRAMDEVSFFGTLDTLEYLQKGGRIGKAQAFLGSLLNIKPLLTIKEGIAHPLERVRTRQRAVERIIAITQEQAPLRELAVLHTTTPQEAAALVERLRPCLKEGQVLMCQVGAVVGTYFGPGMLGVALRRAR